MSKPVSLEAYAAANPPKRGGIPCWACNIPETDEINNSRRKGRSIMTILRWLQVVRGYGDQATKGRLEGHFVNNRHHEKAERGRVNG